MDTVPPRHSEIWPEGDGGEVANPMSLKRPRSRRFEPTTPPRRRTYRCTCLAREHEYADVLFALMEAVS